MQQVFAYDVPTHKRHHGSRLHAYMKEFELFEYVKTELLRLACRTQIQHVEKQNAISVVQYAPDDKLCRWIGVAPAWLAKPQDVANGARA